MHIQSIPMWKSTSNNYAYLVVDEPTLEAVIIDPANPEEIIPVIDPLMNDGKIKLNSIVNTHHHWDHAGGNSDLLKKYKGLAVIGGKDCQAVKRTPRHEETFHIGERIKVTALHTPCHTQDSICWYMEDKDERVVFTGDTLFIGGCGRFFEGEPWEMDVALNKILAALPDDTKIYPGHEYTKSNVKFLQKVLEPGIEEDLVSDEFSQAVDELDKFANENKETQGKKTMGEEKMYNVFMRLNDPAVRIFVKDHEDEDEKVHKLEPTEVMLRLRLAKNNM